MRFQFKLWILICLNVYLDILGLVHGLHIRSPCNFMDNTCLPRYCLIKCNINTKNDDSYTLKNPFSNITFKSPVKFNLISNVLRKITYTNFTDHNFKRIGHKNISQFLFINNRNTDVFKSRNIKLYNEVYNPNSKSDAEKMVKDFGEMIKEYKESTGQPPIYKNEMDLWIDMCTKADHLYEKYGDWEKVYDEMGIKPPYNLSTDTVVCLARNLLNRPAPPRDYFGKMIHELGFLIMYNNIKKMMKDFIKKFENRISPKEVEEFPRNYEYAFGIEPLSFGEKVTPLSERSIRGFLQEKYFEHIEKMAKYNPKRAQKILTVLHRIYTSPDLKSDMDEDVDDDEVLEDVHKILSTYSDCIIKFMKDYPHLKWPSNDDEHLDLYRTWFDPNSERIMKLSHIIKDHYLDNFIPESNSAEKYIVNPIFSVFSGLVLGKATELLTEYLYSKNPDLFEIFYKYKKKFKYLFGFLSYLFMSDTYLEVDYFYEVLKVLYEDVKLLEDKGPESLMKCLSTRDTTSTIDLFTRIFKGSSETYRNTSSSSNIGNMGSTSKFGNLYSQDRYSDEENSDLMEGIINIRKENLIKLADQNGVSYRDFRISMEKTSQVLTFQCFIKMLTMYRYGTLYESDPEVRNRPKEDDDYEDEDDTNSSKKSSSTSSSSNTGNVGSTSSNTGNVGSTSSNTGSNVGNMGTTSSYKYNKDNTIITNRPKIDSGFMDPNRLDEMYKMISNLRYVNDVCLPASKTSVYRLMYHIGCYLAMMGNLPRSYGNEVLGYYISGEDFIHNNMTPEDDYSWLYKEGEKEAEREFGIPPENVEKNKYNAMLLSCFLLQVFSNVDNFVTCTIPSNFGNELDTDYHLFKSMGISNDQLDMFRKIPNMPSTLDEIEEWALKLNQNGGYTNRDKVNYKYGIVPKDEFLGETDLELETRKKYELENMRNDFESLFRRKDKIIEIIESLSMIFHVSEEFMLKTLPGYWLNYVSNMIYRDLENVNNDFNYYIKVFNISDKGINKVKERVMEVHFEHMRNLKELSKIGYVDNNSSSSSDSSNTNNMGSSSNSSTMGSTSSSTGNMNTSSSSNDYGNKSNEKDKEEELNEIFNGIKKVCNKLDLGQDMVYDYFRIFTFNELINDLRKLDLTCVSRKEIEVIKKRYESTDLVLVNALCEVIKEKTNITKKSLIDATGLEDYYLIEKHIQTLINMRRSLIRSLINLVDRKYFYRIDRALQHNKMYLIKDFKYNEIIGRDNILNDNNNSSSSSTNSNNTMGNTNTGSNSNMGSKDEDKNNEKKQVKFGKRVVVDKLKALDGDWELMDVIDPLSEVERAELEEKKEEKRLLKPLPVYGVDTHIDLYEQNRIDELIEKGELPKELRCIPNEFHIGKKEIDSDYDLTLKIPEDKDKDQRALISTEQIFKAWVIYTYRKRKASPQDKEDFKAIFPGCRVLIDKSIKDWRHLYIRTCVRNDDINSVRDWNQELYPSDGLSLSKKNEEEVKKILEYCYEEELLRVTKGAMEEVEDDIGNTEDFFFNAFYPSTNLRMNFVYSHELPDEEKMAYLEKLQKFLHIGPKSLENINSNRFHYALGVYFRSIIQKHEDKPLKFLVNEYFKPISQRLSISQETYTNVLTKSVHDHVVSKMFQFFDLCPIGNTYIRSVDRFLDICKNLELLSSDGSKFSPSLDSHKLNLKVVERFIISSLELNNKVDMDKLNLLCNVIGLKGEQRKTELQNMGRELYYKYMLDHHKDNIFIETFDELAHLHDLYGFDENYFKKIIYDHRLLNVLDIYDTEAGLEKFNKVLDVILEDDANKYLNMNKDTKTHWFMNIMNDLIEKKKFSLTEYLKLIDSNYLSDIYDPFDLKDDYDSNTSSSNSSNNNNSNNTMGTTSGSFSYKDNITDILCNYEQESIYSDYEPSEHIISLSKTSRNSREEFEKNKKGLVDFFLLLMDKLGLSNNQCLEACFHYVENNVNKFFERVRSEMDETYKLDYENMKGMEISPNQGGNNLYLLLVDLLKVLSLTPKNSVSIIRDKLQPIDTETIRKTLIQNSHSLDEQRRTLKLVDLYLEK